MRDIVKMRMFRVPALLLLLYAVLKWFFVSALPTSVGVSPPALVSAPDVGNDTYLSAVTSQNLWSADRDAMTAAPPKTEVKAGVLPKGPWYLRAVVQDKDGGSSAVIASKRQNTAESFVEGDELPNGEQLITILPNGIIFQPLGEDKKTLYMFGKTE